MIRYIYDLLGIDYEKEPEKDEYDYPRHTAAPNFLIRMLYYYLS